MYTMLNGKYVVVCCSRAMLEECTDWNLVSSLSSFLFSSLFLSSVWFVLPLLDVST